MASATRGDQDSQPLEPEAPATGGFTPGAVAGWLARVRRTALITLVAATPLFFLWDVTYDPFNLPKLALVAAGVAVAAGARLGEVVAGAPAAGLRRAAVPAAAVGVPVFISWLASDYRSWSLFGLYGRFEGLVPILLALAVGVLVADAFGRDLRPPAWATAGAAAGVGAYTVLQSLGADPLDIPIGEYAGSTIGHSNFVGGYLAIALPVVLGLWATATGIQRIAAMAAAIPTALGVIFAFAQGGWLAAAAGVAVFGGLSLRERHRRAPLVGGLVAAGLAAAAVGIVLLSLVDPFNPLVPETARARGYWWRGAVSMALDSPVWGHGPNVYAIEGPHYRTVEDALANDVLLADSPHSVPVSHFANHGLLGLAGFVLLGVWTLRRARVRGSPVRDGFVAGAAAYFVQSLVSIDAAPVVLGLWVCVGALAAEPDDSSAAPRAVPGWRVAPALGVAVAVSVAGVWWAADRVAVDARVLDIVTSPDLEPAEAVAELGELVRERPDPTYRMLYASVLGSTALRKGAAGGPEIARMKEAFAFVDDLPDLRALGSYADVLHRWSIYRPEAEPEAYRLYRRMLSLDEYSPSARVAAAEALIRLGRSGDAVETLEFMLPALEDHPRLARGRAQVFGALAIAYFHDGRVDDARAAVETAERVAGEGAETDCHVLVAKELLRTSGKYTARDELLRSSPGLRFCSPTVVALLPGYEPGR